MWGGATPSNADIATDANGAAIHDQVDVTTLPGVTICVQSSLVVVINNEYD